ncbi:hypothetical protein LIER_04088 [Lithospermum erythrorhizon]|uniref:DUF4283 domain-containing protein n=1 Tax=Lithospermum erythrorhizon TaxID=34254 RepID=A0AAV3NVH0_LITER
MVVLWPLNALKVSVDCGGFKPSFDDLEKFAKSNWGDFGFESFHKLSAEMYLFQFHSDAWIFARRPLIIKAWSHDAKIERKREVNVPVWVRIPNLILQFWNEEMLSKIGSYIGKPLVVDSATSSLERMAYARVYVEIDVNWELSEFVPLVDDFWNEFQQKINFERCFHGRAPLKRAEVVDTKTRRFKIVQKWQPKRIPNESKVDDVLPQMLVVQQEIVEDVVVDRIVIGDKPDTGHGPIPVKNAFASLDEDDVELGKEDVILPLNVAFEVALSIDSNPSSGKQLIRNGEGRKKAELTKIRQSVRGSFFLSAVYDKHTPADRRSRWSSLVDDACRMNGEPWSIGGDFNIVRDSSESVGGGSPDSIGMKEFNEYISSINVMELPHIGLDVPVVQESNHCPLDVSITCNIPSDPKPFKYNHFLVSHESFLSIIEGVWNEAVEAFSNISMRVVEMKHEFEEVQNLVLNGDVSNETLLKAKGITLQYNLLCKAKSEFYKNKARMAWYKDGDDNTKLFHYSMRINESKSLITQIHNDNGVLISDYQQVKMGAIEFYKKLFSTQDTIINK